MIVRDNQERVASFISASPIVFGLTIADMFWIVEGIAGAALSYAAFTGTGSAAHWFGGHASAVGIFMVAATFFRVTNFMEEETNMVMSVLLLLAAGSIYGISGNDVTNELKGVTPTFNYHAQTPQKANLPQIQQATLAPRASCVWHNTKQNRALKGTEAQWCKAAVESKQAGSEFCKCL